MEKCPFPPQASVEAKSRAAVVLDRFVMRFVSWLKHKLHRCSEEGCWAKGLGCYLPDNQDDIPDEWVCSEHAHKAGFCWSCRQFHAGIESFDFGRSGLCYECDHQFRADMGEFDEPDEYDCFQDPYA